MTDNPERDKLAEAYAERIQHTLESADARVRSFKAGHDSRDAEVAKLKEIADESGAHRFYNYWMESAAECEAQADSVEGLVGALKEYRCPFCTGASPGYRGCLGYQSCKALAKYEALRGKP